MIASDRRHLDRLVRPLAVALPLVSLWAACGRAADGAADLRAVLDDERRAHLETDASLLASHLADTLVSVEDGVVTRTPRAEVERRFAAYFDGATYRIWDDIESPLIRIADGGGMAWVARRVAVDRIEPDTAAPPTRFESAWTATYEMRGGEWVMTSVASTFVPPEEPARIVAAARRRLGLGGADSALEAIRTRARVTATGSSPGTFTVDVVSASEGRTRLAFSLGMTGVLGGGRDRVRSSADAAPEDVTPAMRAFLRGHEVHWNVLWPETRFGPLRYTGAVRFAGRPAVRLTGTDPAGSAIDLFYAASDTLPLGYEVSDPLGGPTDRVQLVVERWTEDGGPRFPNVASFVQGGDRYRYRFVEIEPLDGVADSLFRLP